MPQNFLSCDRDQPMLLPPDLRDWLDDDHLAWFVIDAVAELDLEPFYADYRADGHGAAAHEPQMMVTLFAYAYAVGERSSRGIERRCRVVAAEITTKGGDFEELDPMISAAERELATAGVDANPGVVLADAGYWSNEHIDSLRERGIVPIVAADTSRNRPRKTRLGGPYDFMRRVITSEAGGELYAKRQCMVEPVFAQIKANRRIERFKRRGRVAARSEWRLIAATHNLLKLHRHQLAAQQPDRGTKAPAIFGSARLPTGSPDQPALRDSLTRKQELSCRQSASRRRRVWSDRTRPDSPSGFRPVGLAAEFPHVIVIGR